MRLRVLSPCQTVLTFQKTSTRHLSGQMLGAFDMAIKLCRDRIFVLSQCRVKFDSEQTLSRHRPNISIVFTVSGSCRVRLTGPHDKSPGCSCVFLKQFEIFRHLAR